MKAIVIGVSDYEHSDSLDFCRNDAEEMRTTLTSLGYDTIDMIGNVRWTEMRDTIIDFFSDQNLNPRDTLLFYYSGHGIPDIDGDVYISNSEIDPFLPDKRGFSFSELTKLIQRSISTRIVAILDCCYSGTAKVSKSGSKDDPTVLGTAAISNASEILREGEGKCILAASQGLQEAYSLKEHNHSLYTYYILEGLRGNELSVDQHGFVTPDTLSKYAYYKIMSLPSDRRPRQKPIRKVEAAGDIILAHYPQYAKAITEYNLSNQNKTAAQVQKNLHTTESDQIGKIKELIEKYEHIVNEKRVWKFNEEHTKAELIEPLFEVLGWDVKNNRNKNEVTREEIISKDRVDYSFRIDGIPKFFLEAKALKANLDDPKFANQAINYAWNKGCTWAVLSDFESIKIYNAEWKEIDTSKNHLKTIYYNEYISRLDELRLLSKESFKNDQLDKEAEKWGRKLKKTPVDKQLLYDFTKIRDLLSRNISKSNDTRHLTQVELDESTQRILDRLIFIRFCEDKELEEYKLIPILREWKSKGTGRLLHKLRSIFVFFNSAYDSKIFDLHLCDKLEIDDEIVQEIIERLYHTKDMSIHYDFSAIEADVLGNIYEQYLGYVLLQTKRSTKLTQSQIHRKEHGIYYTPTHIVDYIIRNTLQTKLKLLKKGETVRVLDPACGSGSFLIKAFDILNEFQFQHDKNYLQTTLDPNAITGIYTKKLEILQNCLFGIDLDKQAVEIAQLNLLLKVAERGHRLPLLQQNIRQGNSLMDTSLDVEDQAFKWFLTFPFLKTEQGFDVIIGNPPYVFGGNTGISAGQKLYFQKNYVSATRKLNLFSLFIERAIKLLKDGGIMGFILPNTLLRVTSYEDIRKLILKTTKILQIVNLEAGVFEGVTASTIIIILQKESSEVKIRRHEVLIYDGLNSIPEVKKQHEFEKSSLHIFDLVTGSSNSSIYRKLTENSVKLGSISKEMIFGVVITKNREKVLSDRRINATYKKFLEGRDIERYAINFDRKYLLYEPKKLHRPRTPKIFEANEKILIQRISGGKRPLRAAYDNEQYYNKESINNIILADSTYKTKFILALLNSSLINWFYATKFTNLSELTVNVSKAYLSEIPIKKASLEFQEKVVSLVDRIITLKKTVTKMAMTDRRGELENEIKRIDKEIDNEVYSLYGLSEPEKNAVEQAIAIETK